MILTTLLYLTAQSDDAASILGRYQAFIVSQPVLTVDVTISGVRKGKGVITVHRSGQSHPKVDWKATIAGNAIRFISDGKTGIDIDVSQQGYDRLPIEEGSFPGGRLVSPYGFPYAIVSGAATFEPIKSIAKASRKGNLYEITATRKSTLGTQTLTADFDGDGRLTRFSIEKGAAGHMSVQSLDFSNYKFGGASAPSTFSVKPPNGYSPLAFDIPTDPVSIGAELPAIRLSGKTSINKIPDGFVAFVDSPGPAGLADSLARLNRDVSVTIVEMKGANLSFGSLPIYFSDSAGFDAACVGATPQFYLVKNAHVVQAWQGFRADAARSFEAEVKATLKGA